MKRIVLLAIILVTGCKRFDAFLTARSRWFQELTPCVAPQPFDRAGWQLVNPPLHRFSFCVPRNFNQRLGVSCTVFAGEWVRDDANVAVEYGNWGLDSFPDRAQKCRTVVDGWPVVVFRRPASAGVSLAAWFVASGDRGRNTGRRQDVLILFRSPQAGDEALFHDMVATCSLRRLSFAGPP